MLSPPGRTLDGATFAPDEFRETVAAAGWPLRAVPTDLVLQQEKTLASLLSTPSKSMPSYGRKVANPRRRQRNRSSDIASAIRGPFGECAVKVS